MQRSEARLVGEAAGDTRRLTGAARHVLLVAGVLGPAAWLVVGCSTGEDLVTTPASGQSPTAAHAPVPADADLTATTLKVTPAQRGFLDALSAAGVHASSELEALSIGSHVCQAHAAGQSDQAVWDYIAPMVRSDVADVPTAASSKSDVQTSDLRVSEATADYIRLATQRLC
ncbi:DUF732 domain-containing protein [Mycolicibacterium sp. CBM1]